MDKDIERSIKDLEQYRMLRRLQDEIRLLVLKYSDQKLNPDLIAGVFMTSGVKVSNALSAALIQKAEREKKGEADEHAN